MSNVVRDDSGILYEDLFFGLCGNAVSKVVSDD